MKVRSLIPHLFTLGNLLCGILAIIYAFTENFEMVAILAVSCLVLDFLDGTIARLLKVTGELGKQLDSLADMVSFGVAPGLVLFWFSDQHNVHQLIAVLFLLIPLFAAFRLAVFNISSQSTEYFSGLPTPAFAVAAFSIPLVAAQSQWYYLLVRDPVFIVCFIVIGCLLMVSKVKLFSLKLGSHNKFMNRLRISFLLVSILILGLFKFFGIILCLIIYLIISLTIQKRLAQL